MVPAVKLQPQRPRPRGMTLREYERRRNQVLVHREIGGLGDILMHRMMFEDFKRAAPGLEVHFACPLEYHPAVEDHPFLDRVLDSRAIDPYDYMVSYNTSTACGRYEIRMAPQSGLHRSDIWAKHCGVDLTRHDMHIRLGDRERSGARSRIADLGAGGSPSVCLCPVSAMPSKNLSTDQVAGLVRGLRERGYFVFGLHSSPVESLIRSRVPTLHGLAIRDWMAAIDQADVTVSVDTSSFHCAGGLGKRLLGVFGWADGKVYGKYYDFVLVQRHRDDGDWPCGPCYLYHNCPKSGGPVKPCMSELAPGEILAGFDRLMARRPLS